MKIYTKTGDQGMTGLYRGSRVPKDHPRIIAYGTVDELNAFMGLIQTESLPESVQQLLCEIQGELFEIGAELASPDPIAAKTATINEAAIEKLERAIDAAEETLPPLKNFILPGGSQTAAMLHLARTVCRRAEREVIALNHTENEHRVEQIEVDQSQVGRSPAEPGEVENSENETVRPIAIIYLNRLSDLLFVLARVANHVANIEDTPWHKPE